MLNACQLPDILLGGSTEVYRVVCWHFEIIWLRGIKNNLMGGKPSQKEHWTDETKFDLTHFATGKFMVIAYERMSISLCRIRLCSFEIFNENTSMNHNTAIWMTAGIFPKVSDVNVMRVRNIPQKNQIYLSTRAPSELKLPISRIPTIMTDVWREM